jgi:PAS domain S-box-containing protein/putative nucleotidyltransferase with HDIG domain
MSESQSPKELLRELAEIRQRLAEAEELILAIRQGEVDSLVISGPQGEEVYPLVHTLRQQLQFQQALMDTIPTPVFYKSLEEEFLGCNQAFAEMVGKSKKEIINRRVLGLFPFDLAAGYRQKDEELIARGGTQEYEAELIFGDNTCHPVITRKTLFCQPDGSIEGIIGVITDITERQRAEVERKRLAAIVNGSDDAIIGKTLEGIITDWNPAAERLYGYTAAEIKGKSVLEVVPPERQAEMANILERVRQDREVEHLFTARRRKDGTQMEVSLTVSPIKDANGQVIGASSIARDITEHLRQERQLKASEERYRLLVEQIPAVVYKGYADWGVDFFDDKIAAFTGYSKADFDSRRLRWNELIVPEDLPGAKKKFVKALRGNKSFVREYRIRRRNGEIIWVQGRSRIYLDNNGQITHVSGVLFDITARKRGEKEIADRQQELQLILDNSPAYMWAKDPSGRYLYASKSLLEASATPASDWISKTDADIIPDQELATRYREDDVTVMNTGMPKRQIIEPLGTKFGSRWVQTDKVPLRDGTGQLIGVLGMAMDITDLKQAHEAVKLNETRLSSLLRISQYSASSIQDLLDYTLEEAIDLTFSKLGYICLYDEATRQLTLNTWSKDVMQECTIVNPPAIYHLEKTGIWGEAVRQAKPIIVNDFQAPHPLKKGYPEGHPQLYKYLTIPVLSQGRIVAVVGVANKATDYDEGDVRQLTLMMDTVWKMVDRQKTADELEAAAKKWRVTFDAITDGICLLDQDQKILQCNQAMAELAGRPSGELLGCSCQEALSGPGASIENCPVPAMFQSKQRESRIVPRNGNWLQVTADPIFNRDGDVDGAVQIIADITERQQAHDKITDLNILLKTIAEINEGLLRVRTEPDLFKNICISLTRVPKFKFTWIGLLQPDSHEIKVVAHAGHEEGYLSTMQIAWDNTKWGQGPINEAIRTCMPVVIEDMEADPRSALWREEASKRGYRSNVSLPLVYQQEIIGVLKVYSGETHAFGPEELEFLVQVAGDVVVGVKSLRMEQELIASLIQLQIILQQTVEAIGTIAELRDPYTAGHQRRVTRLACALAEEMGLDSNRIEGLKIAGLLHDLGKITIAAEILSRPGKLSPSELSLIRTHAEASYEILKNISFPWPVAEICRQHHERLDGSGYPQGLKENDILLEAKIMAVADVVEAMASHRPYRPSLGIEKALEEITKNKGVLYDARIVEACVKLFSEKDFKFEA